LHAYSTYFFFTATATTEIYTLSLHDALPISPRKPASSDQRTRGSSSTMRMRARNSARHVGTNPRRGNRLIMNRSRKVTMPGATADRKSTRLNSSHSQISYAVFCLKKKKQNKK